MAIGAGWVDGAWIDAGWVDGALAVGEVPPEIVAIHSLWIWDRYGV